jgi:TRAP-type C4-dicarboxylate transport system permease small subunit
MSLIRFLDCIFEAITAFFLASMVVLTLLQVVSRYAFQAAFDWTEELARLDLIYLTFLGSIVALRRNQLLRLDFVKQALPSWAQHLLEVAVDIFSMVVLGVVVWQGIPLLWRFWPVRSAALDWPTTFSYLPVVVGCFGMLIFTGLKLIRALRIKGRDMDRKEAAT